MKPILLFIFAIALVSCNNIQGVKAKPKPTEYKVLAKYKGTENCDKICMVRFEVIKDVSETGTLPDEIMVGYYNYKKPATLPDTALLTLYKYDGADSVKYPNYFICTDYDGNLGIKAAKIDFIDFEYWEGCETGRGKCKPLHFKRPKDNKSWHLIMPCGGTQTDVSISGPGYDKKLSYYHAECPPYIELTNLKDGEYHAYMLACGLGGGVTFNLENK